MDTQTDNSSSIQLDSFFTMMLQEDDVQENNTTPSIHNHNNGAPISQPQEYLLHSLNSTISIRQLPSQGLSFQLWPAANTLVKLLDHHCCQPKIGSQLFNLLNKSPLRILELGSGTGIVGIAAAALLGAHVTVTDLPHVLPNIHFNINDNAKVLKFRGGVISAAALSWGESDEMEAIGREYDLILASDVVYHDHLYDPLLQTLKNLMLGGEKEMVFLMAHLKRWKKEATFFKKARKLFDIDVIHTDVPTNGSRTGVVVYRFVTKCRSILSSKNL